jgi:serine/threonine protein phosphatase PrpC
MISSTSRQLGNRQDHAVHGKYSKGYYLGVMDGHGTDKCIDLLRQLDYSNLAESNPCIQIFDILSRYELYCSGSTFNFNTIEIGDKIHITNYNIGDSETMILINGDVVFTTNPHTISNESEKERVRPYLSTIKPTSVSWNPTPINEKRMTSIRSDRCNFATGEPLVPSQSFGHNNMTGYSPDITTITCELTDHVRILCGTDGFWNMIIKSIDMVDLETMSLEGLMDKAEKRWKQEWEYAADVKHLDRFCLTCFPDYDDISLAIWDNRH